MPPVRHHPLGPLVPGEGSRPFLALALEEGRSPLPVVLVWAPPEVTRDPTLLTKLERETQRATIFDHPNILRVHGLVTLDGRLARVTEYADGEPLRKVLEVAHRLPPPFAALVVADVATGVHYAHVAGSDDGTPLIHGDLRPETVMVSFSGVCKVSGYGALSVAPQERNILRKRNQRLYSAPEQLMGGRAASSVLTDVFLLGLLLYECLSGRRPFQDSLEPDKAILNRPLPPLPVEVPAVLNDVVRRATAKRADQRYPSAHAFREALVAASGALPTTAAFAELLAKLLPPEGEARLARKKLLEKGLSGGPITQPVPIPVAERITQPVPVPVVPARPTSQPVPVPISERITQPVPVPVIPAAAMPTGQSVPVPVAARITQPIRPISERITQPTPAVADTSLVETERAIPVAPSAPPAPAVADTSLVETERAIPIGTEAATTSSRVTQPAEAVPPAAATRAERTTAPVPSRRPMGLIAITIGAVLLLSGIGAVWSTRNKPEVFEDTNLPAIEPSVLLTAEPEAPRDAGVRVPSKAPAPAPATPSVTELFVNPDVEVSINGRVIGRTPLTVPLPLGRHTLTFTDTSKGLKTARMIDITHEGTSTFHIRLGMGSVLIQGPEGSRISLNGKDVGTAPLAEMTLFEGVYDVRVTASDGAVWEKTFQLMGDQRQVLVPEFDAEE
ncbi:protein kinase [Archangium violaceum]|uniref:protein kinase domain-containing protein n=1 Tax=Archangium violaceum TaxID=83451 RepID=UPI00195226D6|nr:protein kinase [Archangium violaceum]QRO02214.1 protein kinase [Archangium violaceum]